MFLVVRYSTKVIIHIILKYLFYICIRVPECICVHHVVEVRRHWMP